MTTGLFLKQTAHKWRRDDDDDDNLAHNKIQFYVQIDTLWKTGG